MKGRYLVFFVVTVIVLVFGLLKGLRPDEILNIQALFIVFGGTSLVLLIGFPPKRVMETCKAVRTALFSKRPEQEREKILNEVLRLARIYRTYGPVALEKAAKNIENDFLRFGANLVAEGYDRASLGAALEMEARTRHSERISQIRLLKTLTRLTPSLGMAGTVVSLMQVMGTLKQPGQAGPALGLALSSTLYGVLLANLLFLPLATKLQELAEKEAHDRAVIARALDGIQMVDHPMRIAEGLNAFDLYWNQLRSRLLHDVKAKEMQDDKS